MSRSVKLGACQMSVIVGDIEANLCRLDLEIAKAAQENVEIFVAPETAITGYGFESSKTHQLSIQIPNKTTSQNTTHNYLYIDLIKNLAIKYNMEIILGFVELKDEKYYNSVMWMSNKAKMRTIYRKSHLWGGINSWEGKIFSKYIANNLDDHFKIIKYKGLKFGLLICFDIEFGECSRIYGIQGADCIIVAAAVSGWKPQIFELFPRVRALENTLYVVYCNHPQPIFCGASAIYSPDGMKIVSAGYEQQTLLIADIEPDKYKDWRNKHPYFESRRTELYHKIVSKYSKL